MACKNKKRNPETGEVVTDPKTGEAEFVKIGLSRCRKRADNKSCVGAGKIRVHEFEDIIYSEMLNKVTEFQILTGTTEASGNGLTKANPKLTALNVEILQIEAEIETLINTLTGANQTLLSYANTKI